MKYVQCLLDDWHDLRYEVFRKLQRIQFNSSMSKLEENFLIICLLNTFNEAFLPLSFEFFEFIFYKKHQIGHIMILLILRHLVILSEDREEMIEVLLA